MKNVYESVRYFYEEELLEDPIVAREWVEGFLRQKAWLGTDDAELHGIWEQLRIFLLYLIDSSFQSLDELTSADYSTAVEWLDENVAGFKATLKSVRRFFHVLAGFYHFLLEKKWIYSNVELQHAAKLIAGGKKLNLQQGERLTIDKMKPDWESVISNTQTLLHSDAGAFTGTIEKVMLKMGSYFQKEAFDEDFHRALFLYVGPLQSVPSAEQEDFHDFWIGFWDYFLFDYHLRKDDYTPVEHYYQRRERLTSEEKALLKDLTGARFTIFYIHKILNQDWVECVNLLTEETFQMPYPEYDYKLMKRLLFFGHVFSHGAFMANYVASIEISANLRRRIREEIIRQKAIFEIQKPDATWQDFLNRHSLAVRHTIAVLTSLAKLNVISCHTEWKFPVIEARREPDQAVVELLRSFMPVCGFSFHDIQLAEKLWHDFCQLQEVKIRKAAAWAAAVISCYLLLNSSFSVSVDHLADDLGVSEASIYSNRRKITETLKLYPHDPRYLSEEGFLLLLYTS